jgi:cytochrome c biogenesis protein CcmG, thiol:disulfide interchange protein DsbE
MDAAQVPASRPSGLGAGRLRTILVLAIVAVLVVVAVVARDLAGSGDDGVTVRPGATSVGEPPRVGDQPPDFEATALDGSAVSIAALRGQPTWLTFGASWCPDCRAESPDLQAAYATYGPQGLAIVGVFDEDAAAAKAYADRVGFTFPLVADERGTIANAYGVYGIPIHFFVGRDGTIRDVRIGRLTPADMDEAIGQILGS